MSDLDKTEAPTPKRLEKAREDGQVLRSRDFATALVVLAGAAWFAFAGPSLLAACKEVMAASFTFGRDEVEAFSPFRPIAQAGAKLLPSLLTLFAVSIAAAILSQVSFGAQGWNGKLLMPKASRINPGAGLKRVFGPTGWIELGKSLLKLVLLSVIGWYMLRRVATESIGLAGSDLGAALATLGNTFTAVLFAMAAGLVIIAGVDVPVQLIRLLKKLRMTKQEVRDEHKESDGNPEVKGQQRARARAMMNRNTRKAIAEAHVVLTNPTHFAIALRYERGRDQVPVVVAKGRGATALAIRDLASEAAVPVLEYPQLARALYYTSREGQEVRDDLYLAIATVLAFVFNLNAAAGGSPPPVDVPTGARFDENGVVPG
ncbi:MAG: flagellar biosynthesis protein FlhB [Sphingomonas bacterium]|uniref:flagellar type III secretion system protein FlhB n=1 Tax=Sphingomonas bacterium TaxID=1895847 RepID=UPI002636AC34|nr:flagellar type III secretion system protein FlhB [Sphingomonas bacterium]MDB5694839.1 flagellar biosynthesis protein FlhB [Sphingomonas bacterium]